jgi:membrane protein YdbS with pleckstrin-like domain
MERWVLKVLRVPPAPEPPEGSPGSIQVFHAGRNLYILCMLVWLLSHLAILAVLIAGHFAVSTRFAKWPEWVQVSVRIAESLLFLVFAGSAFITFFSQRLNYRLRWYMVTDRSLRIRTGILTMEELTMTFSNIQEIRLSAGPIQNLLKIADVEVHSAGGGGSRGKGKMGDDGHTGCFEGVSNANEIRDLMVERLRQYRDSGLGETAHETHPMDDGAIHAARAVLAETRSLREFLMRPTHS